MILLHFDQSTTCNVCMSIRDTGLSFSFLCDIFVWFWYQGDADLIEFRTVPSSAVFWNSFRRRDGDSSLNVW